MRWRDFTGSVLRCDHVSSQRGTRTMSHGNNWWLERSRWEVVLLVRPQSSKQSICAKRGIHRDVHRTHQSPDQTSWMSNCQSNDLLVAWWWFLSIEDSR